MGLEGVEEQLEEIDDKADRLVRAFSFEMHRRLLFNTPVDTGRARGNWNLARGVQPDMTVEEDRKDPSGMQTLQRGKAVIGTLKAGDIVWNTNGLPYMPALEDGHSDQQSRGMVKVTVKELETLFSDIVSEVRRGGQ